MSADPIGRVEFVHYMDLINANINNARQENNTMNGLILAEQKQTNGRVRELETGHAVIKERIDTMASKKTQLWTVLGLLTVAIAEIVHRMLT